MNATAAKIVVGAGISVVSLLLSVPLEAQVGAVSGTVTDPSGKGVPNATVSVKNVATGQVTGAQTDPAGLYEVLHLVPGDYEVSASAEGFATNGARATVSADARRTVNLTLAAGLSLGDLGFSLVQTQGSAEDQAKLDRRSHMLKIHQELGLIATVPLLATVISGGFAGGKSSSSSDRNLHAALGAATAGLYYTSAYYAVFAPKVPGTRTRGPIRLHKALAWVHGVGMILTPVLGALADEQRSRGEKVHGIASAHGAVATVTAVAYGASILAVSLKL